jgi:hypothetical protein
MKSVKDPPEQAEERNTLKMPDRAAEEEYSRAFHSILGVCRELGINMDDVAIGFVRGRTTPGKVDLVMGLTPEQQEKAMRHFNVKLFDPNNNAGPNIGGLPIALIAPSGEEKWLPHSDKPPLKRWTGREQQKRTKPKKDTPPDRF